MSDFNFGEYLKNITNDELFQLFDEFEYMNQNGGLPDESVGRTLIQRCIQRYGNTYTVNMVVNKVYCEMACRLRKMS